MDGRTLTWAVLVVVAALGLPSLVLENHPGWWRWLASFRPGTLAAAEGALRATPRRDDEIVILGSSVAVVNVIDQPLGRMLGRPIVNAGIMAAPMCVTAMFTPEVVARRPRTVVYVMAVRDLEVCAPRRRTAFDLDVAWHAVGPWELVSDDTWLAAGLGDWSTIIRHRDVLQMLDEPSGPGWRFHPRYGPRVDETVMAARVARRALVVEAERIDGAGPGFEALTRLVERLRAVGTEVVLVPSPVIPALVEATTGEVGTAWHGDHVRSVARVARSLGIRHVTPEALGEFSPEDFRDPLHLGGSGQVRFTRALGHALR